MAFGDSSRPLGNEMQVPFKEKTMHCTCKDWKPNIVIINGAFAVQSVMAWGEKKGYTGKPIRYCPWCGKKLKVEPIPKKPQ